MKTSSLFGWLLLALAPAAALSAPAAPAAAATAATPATSCAALPALPKAAETFVVGTLRVERFGNHGRPVILVPGLGSGSWVWAGTVRHLRANHVVYALTLDGFDGLPVPVKETGLLDQADASLLRLIESRHIDHPVLVGHSLGGTLALRFAGEHNALLSGVVAVEGLPVFPGMQDLPAAERASRAAQFKAYMAALAATPAQFQAQQMQYMQNIGLIDPAKAACYGELQAMSDPAAVVEYGYEDYGADYRPGLAHITVPLLEIAPFNPADAKAAAQHSGQPAGTAQQKAAFYGSLLVGAPQAKVVTIQPSRHFVMLDQPQKFLAVLDAFLARLPPVTGHD